MAMGNDTSPLLRGLNMDTILSEEDVPFSHLWKILFHYTTYSKPSISPQRPKILPPMNLAVVQRFHY